LFDRRHVFSRAFFRARVAGRAATEVDHEKRASLALSFSARAAPHRKKISSYEHLVGIVFFSSSSNFTFFKTDYCEPLLDHHIERMPLRPSCGIDLALAHACSNSHHDRRVGRLRPRTRHRRLEDLRRRSRPERRRRYDPAARAVSFFRRDPSTDRRFLANEMDPERTRGVPRPHARLAGRVRSPLSAPRVPPG
jgi:hypothetical protein